MNEKNRKIKTALCFMIAAVDILTIIYDILSTDGTMGAYFVVTSVISKVLSYVPTIFIIVFALQREPHRFIVPLYIRAIMSLFSYILRAFIVLFSTFLEFPAFSVSTSENITREPGENAVNLLLSSLILLPHVALLFLCARAISKQKNGEEGFTPAFVIASSLLTALSFVTSAVTHFSIGLLSGTVEAVLLILVVKYVEEKHKEVSDGLRNYPTPEEVSENEQEKS